jgi:hypothetical protein
MPQELGIQQGAKLDARHNLHNFAGKSAAATILAADSFIMRRCTIYNTPPVSEQTITLLFGLM